MEITEANLVTVHNAASAERCFKKALAAASTEPERLQEFIAKYGRKSENGAPLCLGSTDR